MTPPDPERVRELVAELRDVLVLAAYASDEYQLSAAELEVLLAAAEAWLDAPDREHAEAIERVNDDLHNRLEAAEARIAELEADAGGGGADAGARRWLSADR